MSPPKVIHTVESILARTEAYMRHVRSANYAVRNDRKRSHRPEVRTARRPDASKSAEGNKTEIPETETRA